MPGGQGEHLARSVPRGSGGQSATWQALAGVALPRSTVRGTGGWATNNASGRPGRGENLSASDPGLRQGRRGAALCLSCSAAPAVGAGPAL